MYMFGIPGDVEMHPVIASVHRRSTGIARTWKKTRSTEATADGDTRAPEAQRAGMFGHAKAVLLHADVPERERMGPGGYVVTIVMEKLSGVTVSSIFDELTREKRESRSRSSFEGR